MSDDERQIDGRLEARGLLNEFVSLQAVDEDFVAARWAAERIGGGIDPLRQLDPAVRDLDPEAAKLWTEYGRLRPGWADAIDERPRKRTGRTPCCYLNRRIFDAISRDVAIEDAIAEQRLAERCRARAIENLQIA
jgi:hypothetical protein